MKNLIVFIFINLLIFSFYNNTLPQCSDAGVCVIGQKSADRTKKSNSSISIGYLFGYSGKEDDITFNTIKLNGDILVFEKSRLNINIPYTFISGPLGSVNGIGDPIVIWTQFLPLERKSALSFYIGFKFRTGSVNLGDSLPQAYQPGLGTNDLLLGAGYKRENFFVAAAYQKPFGRSENKITRLKRGDDVFVRMGYNQPFKKLSVKGEILVIKRIQESTIQNPFGISESFVDVDNSNPLQINLLAELTYSISKNIDIHTSAALPLLKRDNNIDGLKRTISVGAGLSYLFRIR
ncbi:MAG: hypothetical protein ACRDFC_03960 [Ignavibacteria bacterium]